MRALLAILTILATVGLATPAGAHPQIECQRHIQEFTELQKEKTAKYEDLITLVLYLRSTEQKYIEEKDKVNGAYNLGEEIRPDLQVQFDIVEEAREELYQNTRALLHYAMETLLSDKKLVGPLNRLFDCLRIEAEL